MDARQRVAVLVADAGTTHAEQAGIEIADRPAELWQLLMLSNLVSARIQAEIAVTGTASLVAAGAGTPAGTLELDWQQRKDALIAGRYQHFADGTATRLGECARLAEGEYGGDLRRLAAASQGRPERTRALLQRFPGIGPAGAAAFCREAQAVWPHLRPALDPRATAGAERLGLPTDPAELADLIDPADLHRLADALVRAALDPAMAERVLAATPDSAEPAGV
ncbi:endonuclease [Kitasatospora griseola]|uniref:Endonuclease n=1 Tax=Kitasatospora griseola TaxID=2064 RepID=A0A0D0PWJ9_KITGR|nr:endonuclease [Kitasatospora griseola]KIQ66809.1 endonuclease [Kitasatospora griseola]